MDETGSTRHWLDDPPTVGAVLVAHNGAAWLPKVLSSFAEMFHAPLELTAVVPMEFVPSNTCIVLFASPAPLKVSVVAVV